MFTPMLTLKVQPPDIEKSYQIFELDGDMDKVGLDAVKEKLEGLAENFPYKYFVFDFTSLNFINSESIGFLMALHSHLAKMKKSLIFVSAKAHVKDVFSVIGILTLIEYHDTLEDFKKKLA